MRQLCRRPCGKERILVVVGNKSNSITKRTQVMSMEGKSKRGCAERVGNGPEPHGRAAHLECREGRRREGVHRCGTQESHGGRLPHSAAADAMCLLRSVACLIRRHIVKRASHLCSLRRGLRFPAVLCAHARLRQSRNALAKCLQQAVLFLCVAMHVHEIVLSRNAACGITHRKSNQQTPLSKSARPAPQANARDAITLHLFATVSLESCTDWVHLWGPLCQNSQAVCRKHGPEVRRCGRQQFRRSTSLRNGTPRLRNGGAEP